MLQPFKARREFEFLCAVYRIVCLTTGHSYVGSSSNLITRICNHRSQLYNHSHSCTRLQEEWDQYGLDDFRLEILEETTVEQAHLVEAKYKRMFYDTGNLLNSLDVSPIFLGSNPKPITLHPQRVKAYWERVVQNRDECWGWSGSVFYGRSALGDFDASRVAYMIHHGEDPGHLFVRHSCHNPICTKPDHLLLGTAKDNKADQSLAFRGPRMIANENLVKEVRDRYKKGESIKDLEMEYGRSLRKIVENKSFRDPDYVFVPRGTRRGGRKRTISQETIDNVRKRGRGGEGSRALAKEYGISQSLVCQIISGTAFPEAA